MTEAEVNQESEKIGNILIIDDNQDVVDIIAEMIKQHTRLNPVTATSGKEGLRIVDSTPIDVIILDLLMPQMDGIEFFQIIRNKSVSAPVIFLTGKGDEEVQKKAFELGAFDFLAKPTKAADLFLLIDEAYKVVNQIRSIISKKDSA